MTLKHIGFLLLLYTAQALSGNERKNIFEKGMFFLRIVIKPSGLTIYLQRYIVQGNNFLSTVST